jgi:uncharacterized membrane protein YedE/YeeE
MKWNRTSLIGGALALIGISVFLKILVGVDVPIVRIGLLFLFIYVGVRVAMEVFGLSGSFQIGGKEAVAFGEAEFRLVGQIEEKQAFAIALGKGTLDLSTAQAPVAADAVIELGVVMGEARVYYSRSQPLRIATQSVLGDVTLPDGNSAFVGSLTYATAGLGPETRCVRLQLTIFCGRVTFVEGSLPCEEPKAEPPRRV